MKALGQILQKAVAQPEATWALATLVRTHGSTYRQPGARLLVDEVGQTTGVLSGGCLEDEIGRHGREVVKGGEPQLLQFDTRRLFGCAGFLEVLLERIPPAGRHGSLLTAWAERWERRESCRIATRFIGRNLGSNLLASSDLLVAEEGLFIHQTPIPPYLLLCGSGPEITPIQELCGTLGWKTELIDHPSQITDCLVPDEQTAGLVLTHNFGRDLTALHALLPLRLPYVGLLGPRRRQAELLERLQEFAPLPPESLATLHSPAGLDIGSESPEEIALSIVSEIAAVLAQRTGGFLRDRGEAIHERSGVIEAA